MATTLTYSQLPGIRPRRRKMPWELTGEEDDQLQLALPPQTTTNQAWDRRPVSMPETDRLAIMQARAMSRPGPRAMFNRGSALEDLQNFRAGQNMLTGQMPDRFTDQQAYWASRTGGLAPGAQAMRQQAQGLAKVAGLEAPAHLLAAGQPEKAAQVHAQELRDVANIEAPWRTTAAQAPVKAAEVTGPFQVQVAEAEARERLAAQKDTNRNARYVADSQQYNDKLASYYSREKTADDQLELEWQEWRKAHLPNATPQQQYQARAAWKGPRKAAWKIANPLPNLPSALPDRPIDAPAWQNPPSTGGPTPTPSISPTSLSTAPWQQPPVSQPQPGGAPVGSNVDAELIAQYGTPPSNFSLAPSAHPYVYGAAGTAALAALGGLAANKAIDWSQEAGAQWNRLRNRASGPFSRLIDRFKTAPPSSISGAISADTLGPGTFSSSTVGPEAAPNYAADAVRRSMGTETAIRPVYTGQPMSVPPRPTPPPLPVNRSVVSIPSTTAGRLPVQRAPAAWATTADEAIAQGAPRTAWNQPTTYQPALEGPPRVRQLTYNKTIIPPRSHPFLPEAAPTRSNAIAELKAALKQAPISTDARTAIQKLISTSPSVADAMDRPGLWRNALELKRAAGNAAERIATANVESGRLPVPAWAMTADAAMPQGTRSFSGSRAAQNAAERIATANVESKAIGRLSGLLSKVAGSKAVQLAKPVVKPLIKALGVVGAFVAIEDFANAVESQGTSGQKSLNLTGSGALVLAALGPTVVGALLSSAAASIAVGKIGADIVNPHVQPWLRNEPQAVPYDLRYEENTGPSLLFKQPRPLAEYLRY